MLSPPLSPLCVWHTTSSPALSPLCVWHKMSSPPLCVCRKMSSPPLSPVYDMSSPPLSPLCVWHKMSSPPSCWKVAGHGCFCCLVVLHCLQIMLDNNSSSNGSANVVDRFYIVLFCALGQTQGTHVIQHEWIAFYSTMLSMCEWGGPSGA